MSISIPKELKTLEMDPLDKLRLVSDLQEMYLYNHARMFSKDVGYDLWMLSVAIIQGSYVRWPFRKSVVEILIKDYPKMWERTRPFVVFFGQSDREEMVGRRGLRDLTNYIGKQAVASKS